MKGMTVLISPLSWGFGHAGRMIPVAKELIRRGCNVIFAADRSLLQLVARELPDISLVEIPGLRIRYSRHLPQYICIVMQTPRIIASSIREHRVLRRLVTEFSPSVIVSDNRFGFFNRKVFSAYVTHQLRIPFPAWLRFIEPVAAWIHMLIINSFDLCLVPDFPGIENLSGRLSHGVRLPRNVVYTGPLSRFAGPDAGETGGSVHGAGAVAGTEVLQRTATGGVPGTTSGAVPGTATGAVPGTTSGAVPGNAGATDAGDSQAVRGRDISPYACLILSGPEPQRTLLLEKVAEVLQGVETVALSSAPIAERHKASYPSVNFITAPETPEMRRIIMASALVIARAGYTSVMELFSMGKGAVIIPTPGQPEQEYLGRHLNGRYGFITLEQGKLGQLAGRTTGTRSAASIAQGEIKSFADALFEKAFLKTI